MPKYEVYTEVTLRLQTEVEAKDREEAKKAVFGECLAGHGEVVEVNTWITDIGELDG